MSNAQSQLELLKGFWCTRMVVLHAQAMLRIRMVQVILIRVRSRLKTRLMFWSQFLAEASEKRRLRSGMALNCSYGSLNRYPKVHSYCRDSLTEKKMKSE
jgi:hypothetical protein